MKGMAPAETAAASTGGASPCHRNLFNDFNRETAAGENSRPLQSNVFFSDEGTVIVGRSADTEQSPPLRPTAAALKDVSIASTGAQ